MNRPNNMYGRAPALLGSFTGATRLLAAFLILAFAVSSSLSALAATVTTSTFSNTTLILVNDNAVATPSPSEIDVTGLAGTVTNVTVTLTNINHAYPNDLDVLLVGPDGKSVVLTSDVGGTTPGYTNVTLTFKDSASQSLAQNVRAVSGDYKPSNFYPTGDSDNMLPAAFLPYGTTMANLNGLVTAPKNGKWLLYVVDDSSSDFGTIGGWEITFITTDGANLTPALAPIGAVTMNEDSSLKVTSQISDDDSSGFNVIWSSSNSNLLQNIGVGITSGKVLELTLNPTANKNNRNAGGKATITVKVNDGNSDSAPITFDVNVTPINDPPTITSSGASIWGTTTNILEDADWVGPFEIVVGDNETSLDQLTVLLNSSNKELIPPTSVIISGTGSVRQVQFKPLANQHGFAQLIISVTDGAEESPINLSTNLWAFGVTVIPVNDPPWFGLSVTNFVRTLEDVATNISLTVGDVDNFPSELTIHLVSTNQALFTNQIFTSSAIARTIPLVPQPNAWGTNTITLEVWDTNGIGYVTTNVLVEVASVIDSLSVAWVTSTNTAFAGPVTINEEGVTNLYFAVSDPDGLFPVNGQVTVAGSPAVATFAPAAFTGLVKNTAILSVATGVLDAFTGSAVDVTVKVWDTNPDAAGSRTNTAVIKLNINPINDGPYFVSTEGPVFADIGILEDEVTPLIPFAVNDVDNLATNLVITLAGTNTSLFGSMFPSLAGTSLVTGTNIYNNNYINFTNINGTNRAMVLKPATNVFGTNKIEVVVTDGSLKTTNSFVLVVVPVNDAPWFIDLASSLTVIDGMNTSEIFKVTDAWGETPAVQLTVTSQNPPTWITNIIIGVNNDTRTAYLQADRLNNTTDQIGTVEFVVTDGTLQTVQTVNLTLTPRNDPPVISNLNTNNSVNEDTLAAISFTTTDPETVASSLFVKATSSDQSKVKDGSITFADAGGSWTNRLMFIMPEANANGPVDITIWLSDLPMGSSTFSNTVSAKVTLNILPVNDNPTINWTNATSVTIVEDTLTNFAFLASDVETPYGDVVYTFSVVADPGNVLGGGTATFEKTTYGAILGLKAGPNKHTTNSPSITFQVKAKDNNNVEVTSATVTVTVAPDNDAPQFIDLPAQITATEDDPPVTVSFKISDVETSVTNFVNYNNLNTTNAAFNWDVTKPRLWITLTNGTILTTNQIAFGNTNGDRFVKIILPHNAEGTQPLGFVLTDGGEFTSAIKSTTNWVTLIVTNVNDAPGISPIADVTTPEDTATQPILFTVDDPETKDYNFLTNDIVFDDPSLIASRFIGGTNAQRFLVITPKANVTGSTKVTVYVIDQQGAQNSTTFKLTIAAVNDVPKITGYSVPPKYYEIMEDTPSVTLTNFFISDEETNPTNLTISVTSLNSAIPASQIFWTFIETPNESGPGADAAQLGLTFFPTSNWWDTNDTHYITLWVSDGVNSTSANFLLKVVPVNDKPTITLPTEIPNSTNFLTEIAVSANSSSKMYYFNVADPAWLEDAAGILKVVALSSNESILKSTNVIIGRNGGQAFFRLTPEANKSGVVTVTFTVTDMGEGSSYNVRVPESSSMTITVKIDDALPNITIAQATVVTPEDVNATVNFTVGDKESAATDLITSAMSTHPALGPTNLVITGTGSNRVVNIFPAKDKFGTNVVTVYVVDGNNNTNSSSFMLEVVSVNDLPTITTIVNAETTPSKPTTPATFTVGDTETAAGDLTLSASSSDTSVVPAGNVVFGGSGASRTVTVIGGTAGTATVTVTVKDTDNGTATTTFTVDVKGVNTAPVIADLKDTTIEPSSFARVSFKVHDAETRADSLIVTTKSENQTLIPDGNIFPAMSAGGTNRDLVIIPVAGQSGSAKISVWASDGTNTTAASFILTVKKASGQNNGTDFSGDGKADILLQSVGRSTIALWKMDGTTFAGGEEILTSDANTSWNVVGTGDFNKDGSADIVLQDTNNNFVAIWYMNGKALLKGAYLTDSRSGGLFNANGTEIVAVADYDNDGALDLIVQSPDNTMVGAWTVKDDAWTGGQFIAPFVNDPNYEVVGVADINGDSKVDIILQQTTTDDIVAWPNGDFTAPIFASIGAGAGVTGYEVVAVADFDQDGKVDFVVSGPADNAIWLMDGMAIKGGAFIPSDSSFNIVGPK